MKPIREYEDKYTITPEGVVTRIDTGRVLKHTINPVTGYVYVSLWKGNIGKTKAVHRLVAEHFLPRDPTREYVNHKDSDRTNPHVDNLEWCTQSENLLHGYEFGYMTPRKHFDEDDLTILFNSFLDGESMTSLAEARGVGLSRLTINLRNFAEKTDQIKEFEEELYRQKCDRNAKANEHKKIPILQWTKEGEFIQEFESISSAAAYLGKKSSGSISNALNPAKSQKTAYGYVWTYK